MGFRFRKQVGPKGLKLNIGKSGVNSTSIKFAKGITYNSKRGLTLGIPGTGISYNFGKKKAPTQQRTQKPTMSLEQRRALRAQSLERMRVKKEYNKAWKEFTGGYSRNALIALVVSFAICLTPLQSVGIGLLLISWGWLILDASFKKKRYDNHLKESNQFRGKQANEEYPTSI